MQGILMIGQGNDIKVRPHQGILMIGHGNNIGLMSKAIMHLREQNISCIAFEKDPGLNVQELQSLAKSCNYVYIGQDENKIMFEKDRFEDFNGDSTVINIEKALLSQRLYIEFERETLPKKERTFPKIPPKKLGNAYGKRR